MTTTSKSSGDSSGAAAGALAGAAGPPRATRDGRGAAERTAERTADLALVLDRLRELQHTMRTSSLAAEREVGVSGAQLLVLQQLAQAPAQSLSELAERTHTRHSSVSEVVSRLVSRRLVTRRPSAADSRRVVLDVTAAGRALLRAAPAAEQGLLVVGLQRLSRPTLRGLADALALLTGAMGDARPGARPAAREAPRAVPRPKRQHAARAGRPSARARSS